MKSYDQLIAEKAEFVRKHRQKLTRLNKQIDKVLVIEEENLTPDISKQEAEMRHTIDMFAAADANWDVHDKGYVVDVSTGIHSMGSPFVGRFTVYGFDGNGNLIGGAFQVHPQQLSSHDQSAAVAKYYFHIKEDYESAVAGYLEHTPLRGMTKHQYIREVRNWFFELHRVEALAKAWGRCHENT